MKVASAMVRTVRIVRRRFRRMLRSTNLIQLNITPPSDRAQRFDQPNARGAPRRHESAERADYDCRDHPRHERAHRQPKPEDELADIHELAAEAGRIRDQHAEYLAEDAAGDREYDALDHEADQYVRAAEAQHSQHADFAGAARDRGIHRVHRAEYRSDCENQRDDQSERAQLIDERGLLGVKILLRHRIDPEPRVG